MNELKVSVVKFSGRKNLMLRYIDPLSKKPQHKSAETHSRKEAERAAARWEKELREGTYTRGNISWADFKRRYEDEVLSGLADATARKLDTVFATVEKYLNPTRLRELTPERISMLTARLREAALSESTIESYLAHLAAALRWAEQMKLLSKAPTIKRPKRTAGGKMMKGRPITLEEFERMLVKCAAVVGDEAAASWQRYLRGLWLSGLRLEESLELWWDRPDRLCVDLDGKRPMLRIPAELDKGHKTRLLPMSPEFAEFLMATPEAARSGRVFELPIKQGKGERLSTDWVSRIISNVGKAAGVKVNTSPTGEVKFASAHDLRRSFGQRWANRVMPAVLQQLMRHETIETTMKYYVGKNAESTADVLWRAHEAAKSNTSGNTPTAAVEIGDSKNVVSR